MISKDNFDAEEFESDSGESERNPNDFTGIANDRKEMGMDVDELDEGQAWRTPANTFDEMESWQDWHLALQSCIRGLNDLTKTRIQHFFPAQYNAVMDTLRRAFLGNEKNSLMVLARSKQTLHALMCQVENDIRKEIDDPDTNLRVIKVNSTLNNSENKIQQKFYEALGFKDQASKQLTSIEMMEKVQQHFEENPNLSILFIFEDIDYYVETTRQVMLYKILDMLQQVDIKFVFLATSMKQDVTDSFEKRIKSRFSHRHELLYTLDLNIFKFQVSEMINEKRNQAEMQQPKNFLSIAIWAQLQDMLSSGAANDVLVEHITNGKGYEYLAQQLRIALSYVDQKLQEHDLKQQADPAMSIQKSSAVQFVNYQFRCGISTLERIKSNAEYSTVLVNLPKAQIIVLIFAYKKACQLSLFNFDKVYQMYKNYMGTHQRQMEIQVFSRAQFLKLFLDLIDKGFLTSVSDMDILNVNNDIAMGFSLDDFKNLLNSKQILEQLQLPSSIQNLATSN